MVKQFKFRLEQILSYRRSLTQKERIGLAREVGVLSQAEAASAQLRGYLNEMSITQIHTIEAGTTGKEAVNLHEHRLRVEEAIVHADGDIVKARENVEKQRELLVEKRRGERAIEMYRSRKWKAWLKDYYRDENRTLDDLGMIRHVMNEN